MPSPGVGSASPIEMGFIRERRMLEQNRSVLRKEEW